MNCDRSRTNRATSCWQKPGYSSYCTYSTIQPVQPGFCTVIERLQYRKLVGASKNLCCTVSAHCYGLPSLEVPRIDLPLNHPMRISIQNTRPVYFHFRFAAPSEIDTDLWWPITHPICDGPSQISLDIKAANGRPLPMTIEHSFLDKTSLCHGVYGVIANHSDRLDSTVQYHPMDSMNDIYHC